MILLVTDTHFDDNPANEYRWKIFEHLRKAINKHNVKRIIHCGDAVDRKDRFSASFVNRLVQELISIPVPMQILRGNHDSPLNGPAFFAFLNQLEQPISYITEPKMEGNQILLPFAANPLEEWRHIRFADFRVAFMHATIQGAVSENGRPLDGPKFPIFPRSLKIYSGDVHVPQHVKNITYIGCPYPIKFGDSFQGRMLLLDERTYEIVAEIKLDIQQKVVLTVSSLAELRALSVQAGSQVRIVFDLASEEISNWGAIEVEAEKWAANAGISISSIEAVLEQSSTSLVNLDLEPESMLRQFAQAEKLEDRLLQVGLDLLK